MKQTEVLFFFDTEDFTSLQSGQAARQLAEICTQEGVTGHFAVVGLVAKQWMDMGCSDVIGALKKHEIGTHTYGHTLHPDLCERTDLKDFQTALESLAPSETEALALLQKVFGIGTPLFAVPPGNSKSYVAMYLYARLGIPCYCDTVVHNKSCSGIFCCNALHIPYLTAVEDLAFSPDASLDRELDRLAQMDRVILYTHPNMAYFSEFWDSVNFKGKNLHPDGAYEPCPPRTEEETRRYFETFRQLIRRVQGDSRFKITTLRQVLAGEKPRTPVKKADIPALWAALKADYRPVAEPSLSLYDLFAAAVTLLRGGASYRPGFAYGLLEEPRELECPVTLSARGIREAAQKIRLDTFLPAGFQVDGASLGWGDMLYAMFTLLAEGGDSIRLTPHPPMTFQLEFPEMWQMSLKGTWMHSEDFEDRYLSHRLRLQVYTIRPE